MSLLEQLRRARARKFPDYEGCCAKVERLSAKMTELQRELEAAKKEVAAYGAGPRDFDLAIQLVEEQLGKDA